MDFSRFFTLKQSNKGYLVRYGLWLKAETGNGNYLALFDKRFIKNGCFWYLAM
jgi:hypothetical protein